MANLNEQPIEEVIAEVRRLRRLADEVCFGDITAQHLVAAAMSEGDFGGRDLAFAVFAANHIERLCDALECYLEMEVEE